MRPQSAATTLLLVGSSLCGLTIAAPTHDDTYEYIVVGSGPGGGPLAANLARAGHSVLLLEAGDDQGENVNVTQIMNANMATNDPATRWDFFVEHSTDPGIQERYLYTTYRNPDGSFYVGLDPPADAERLGVWYPRAGTLGGCAMHNAGISHLPNHADWDYIAEITGDDGWKADNMRQHYVSLENCTYVPEGTDGHGFDGYLTTSMANAGWVGSGSDVETLGRLAATAVGQNPDDLEKLINADSNAVDPDRDQTLGLFSSVTHSRVDGIRSNGRNYIIATLNDPADYPLTLKLESLVTKVLFDKESSPPRATGVEYLSGKSLYSADPRSSKETQGEKRTAHATREVIISGGVFNSPQILKLSGIGPKDELTKFDIPLIKHLPGVGTHMSDNYEGGIISLASRDLQGPLGGFNAMLKTTSSPGPRDLFLFCGPFALEGFWPGYPNNYGPSVFSCAMSHIYPRSREGTVTLRSADPRDTPEIQMRFFERGAEEDLTALLEGIKVGREMFMNAPEPLGPFEELHPCAGGSEGECSEEEQKDYLRTQVYSHHATSSCAIGADGDETTVLDSKFRVRGVTGLRVVDGSAFPRVPGAFPVLPTFMLSEKATKDILGELEGDDG
ncbi:hypothetical protein AJ79_08091 [Helicocarpus griseus UAMH5409]|uniref:Glucose-methanol-choline oxidoreductase N-terminal domain-containing protein n=1 Tax=Helicocarpus griseus UAMH5409 TaxID=1447875 RepID=A0A2B7WW65_9EURO|nr:hypothetical protein AJ79_08091 [Helicocarpus griseus UAMH5409]